MVSSLAQAVNEIGIDRSNLTRESEAVQEKTLQEIHALHATWFRDVLSGTTPQTVASGTVPLKRRQLLADRKHSQAACQADCQADRTECASPLDVNGAHASELKLRGFRQVVG